MRGELQVAVDCSDPARLVAFWTDALGYSAEPDLDSAGEWAAIVDPAGAGPRVLFHRVPESKAVKNRLHLDVRIAGPRGTPVAERRPLVDAEADRLVGRGATHVRTIEEEGDYFAVMLDPEGNEFCVC